jgi:hypothetical protein
VQENDESAASEPDLDEGLRTERLAEEVRLAIDRLTVLRIGLLRHVEWRRITLGTIAADVETMSGDIADDELLEHVTDLENRGIFRRSATLHDGEQVYDVDVEALQRELQRMRSHSSGHDA